MYEYLSKFNWAKCASDQNEDAKWRNCSNRNDCADIFYFLFSFWIRLGKFKYEREREREDWIHLIWIRTSETCVIVVRWQICKQKLGNIFCVYSYMRLVNDGAAMTVSILIRLDVLFSIKIIIIKIELGKNWTHVRRAHCRNVCIFNWLNFVAQRK